MNYLVAEPSKKKYDFLFIIDIIIQATNGLLTHEPIFRLCNHPESLKQYKLKENHILYIPQILLLWELLGEHFSAL